MFRISQCLPSLARHPGQFPRFLKVSKEISIVRGGVTRGELARVMPPSTSGAMEGPVRGLDTVAHGHDHVHVVRDRYRIRDQKAGGCRNQRSVGLPSSTDRLVF